MKVQKNPYPRKRGSIVSVPSSELTQSFSYVSSETGPGPTSYYTLDSELLCGRGAIIDDIVTPGFRLLSARGVIVNNPYTKKEVDTTLYLYSGPHAVTKPENRPGPTYTYSMSRMILDLENPLWPSVSAAKVEDLQQNAVNKAHTAAYQVDVLAVVDYAERAQTFSMLGTHLSSMLRLLRSVKSGPKGLYHFMTHSESKRKVKSGKLLREYTARSGKSVVADASSLWLSVQYGYIPLMLSIEGMVKILTEDKPQRQTFRGYGSLQQSLTEQTEEVIATWQTARLIRSVTVTSDLQVRAGVITEYHPGIMGKLGLNSPLTVGYELIPYSFVLDWFWDINNVISAMNPPKGFTALATWASLTSHVTYVHNLTITEGTGTDGYWRVTYNPATSTITQNFRNKSRVPNVKPGISPPDLNFRSYTHAVSGVALVLSRILSGKR